MRTYAIAMGIRTACVIGLAVVDHWTRVLFLPAAVILPYIAVLIANAGRERARGLPATVVTGRIRPELTAGPHAADGPDRAGEAPFVVVTETGAPPPADPEPARTR